MSAQRLIQYCTTNQRRSSLVISTFFKIEMQVAYSNQGCKVAWVTVDMKLMCGLLTSPATCEECFFFQYYPTVIAQTFRSRLPARVLYTP
jgi:hypothetical protein